MSLFTDVEYLYDWTVTSLVTLHNYILSHEDGASQDSNQLMILRILGGGDLWRQLLVAYVTPFQREAWYLSRW